MADIFISYKRDERAYVERLSATLRTLSFDVWFDAGLSAGESFSDEIDREVRAAKVVLVCWSPSAAASQWVKAEAQVGFAKGNLVSAYIAGPDGFDAPVPFNSLHIEDLRSWAAQPSARDRAWLSVLRRVGGITGRTDVAEWGALGSDATAEQIDAWLLTHGSKSPLVLEAEGFLRERKAGVRERLAAEDAARERIRRLQAEKTAAEIEARAARMQAGPSTSEAWIKPHQPLVNAAGFWERTRILYNALILAVVALRFAYASAEGGIPAGISLDWLLGLVVFANACFCAAYIVDVLAQSSPWRTSIKTFRRVLATAGIAFALWATAVMSANWIYPQGF